MLVLSRRVGESVQIDQDVSVTVLKVKGDRVRLGIAAPNDIKVHRQEIWLKIQDGDDETGQTEAKPAA
ncbi:carbon storage regulator CsrA [Bremerella sp. T1]|uniref:carbon storage regulator CsrA n=1 Tax=Bremerella sp. TYQ1 TaxID=3119568 RepID=UPI001CCA669F|nr:carbon storage regulator CsrA [Bremerella volcania]UBM38401.1 carbon storage regulator CsrA [Bremerella volcania]